MAGVARGTKQHVFWLLAIVFSAGFPSTGLAERVPTQLQGTWSRDCKNPSEAKVTIDAAAVTVAIKEQRHVYKGVDVSRTWYGGAKASNDTIWLPTSQTPGKQLEFVIAATPGKNGFFI